MRLVFFHSLFIYPKDTAQYSEVSSLYVLIDVLIDVLILDREVVVEIKSPGKWFESPARVRVDDCVCAITNRVPQRGEQPPCGC